MPVTTGLVVVTSRPTSPGAVDDWSRWYDDHLEQMSALGGGAWAATRWELTPRPAPGMPGVGFSHVTLYELDGDPHEGLAQLVATAAELRRRGQVHPAHAVIDATAYRAHGRWWNKPEPTAELTGHILAQVMCADPAREPEWDAWYDEQHVPDMLASDAFSAATRWVRMDRRPAGPNHLTLYDIALPEVTEAVERSAAVMPGLVAAGRKHPAHCGALTVVVGPTGRHATAGWRRP